MKKPPANGEGRGGFCDAEQQAHSTAAKFCGTDNPRHLRALNALLRRAMPREHIDREAGCSNGPDLVADLRARGLEIPCDRVPAYDRDGLEVKRGVYHLTTSDRARIRRWLNERARGQA